MFKKMIAGLLVVATMAFGSLTSSPALAVAYDSGTLTAPSGTLTGAGSTASVAVSNANLRIAQRGNFFLDCTALTGSTLDVKLQVSYDGTNWSDLPNGAFTQLNAAGSKVLRLDGPFGYKLRYYFTNGATVSAATWGVKYVIHY